MIVVLLGPPGAGKGTQAAALCRSEGLVHLSTGEMLRAEISRGTALGARVKAIVESGNLVSDEVVGEVVEARLSQPDSARGVLLDGYPRNVRQAEDLAVILERLGRGPAVALAMDVDDQILVARLSARRSCPTCGPRPPADAETCATCGAATFQRADDRPEVIRERLRVYHLQTAPVARYYEAQGRIATVDGAGSPAEVEALLAAALNSLKGGMGR